MTSSKLIAGTALLLVPAFFIYMLSESVLREAAVAGVNPEQVNTDTILKELPSHVRDSVSYTVTLSQFKDAVQKASSDPERAMALCNLADYTKDIKEKEELFAKVIKDYAKYKESSKAFFYFFNKPEPVIVKIGETELQKYITQFSFLDQFPLWGLALAKLKTDNMTEVKQMDFLMPLLDLNPDFKDYTTLYEKIAYFASRQGKPDIYDKARKCEDKCLKYPSIETVLMKELLQQNQKQGKKIK